MTKISLITEVKKAKAKYSRFDQFAGLSRLYRTTHTDVTNNYQRVGTQYHIEVNQDAQVISMVLKMRAKNVLITILYDRRPRQNYWNFPRIIDLRTYKSRNVRSGRTNMYSHRKIS